MLGLRLCAVVAKLMITGVFLWNFIPVTEGDAVVAMTEVGGSQFVETVPIADTPPDIAVARRCPVVEPKFQIADFFGGPAHACAGRHHHVAHELIFSDSKILPVSLRVASNLDKPAKFPRWQFAYVMDVEVSRKVLGPGGGALVPLAIGANAIWLDSDVGTLQDFGESFLVLSELLEFASGFVEAPGSGFHI